MGWSGRAPGPPASETCQGAKIKEPATYQQFGATIVVIGMDIGKNSFPITAVPLC